MADIQELNIIVPDQPIFIWHSNLCFYITPKLRSIEDITNYQIVTYIYLHDNYYYTTMDLPKVLIELIVEYSTVEYIMHIKRFPIKERPWPDNSLLNSFILIDTSELSRNEFYQCMLPLMGIRTVESFVYNKSDIPLPDYIEHITSKDQYDYLKRQIFNADVFEIKDRKQSFDCTKFIGENRIKYG